jgi:drug/metabolite transporter (DMT)-like permease
MFSLSGVSIKLAASALPSESIVFWRNAASLLILAPWALLHRRRCFRRDNIKLITARALAVLASLYCYYYSVALIPLADAVLLNFSSPLFVPLLGLLLFRLPLDRVVQLAVMIGFLGVTIVLQPGSGVFQPAAVVGLIGGGLGGLAVVVLWRMPSSESPVRVAFFLSLVGLVISAAPMAAAGVWPGPEQWPALAMLGVFSTAAHLLLTLGCLIAPADRVITLDYLAVIFAALLGWLIWDERPEVTLLLGGLLIIGAGIFVIRSRRRRPAGRSRSSSRRHQIDSWAGRITPPLDSRRDDHTVSPACAP